MKTARIESTPPSGEAMSRADRMRADIIRLAADGDSPALAAVVRTYIEQSRRDANPRARRIADWYMNLPHNRYVCAPAWQFLRKHGKITLPVAYLVLVGEIALMTHPWR